MNKILMDKKVIDIIDNFTDINLDINNNTYVINFFSNNQKDMNINVIQNENSTLIINYVSLIKNDSNINIKVQITGNNNKTIINVRSIAENNYGSYKVVIHANKNTKNNEVIEDLKGINEQGSVNLTPILEIDSKECNAQHFATIGKFNEDELFYLESKGISKNECINLLKRKFLYSLFSKDFINKLKGDKYE